MALTRRSLWWFVAILFILLVAAGLRLHALGAQSFWNDEGSSYVQATRSFADSAANAARDIHPPGYYWLLAIWRVFTGDSEFALRSLSAFASVIGVALAYAIGRRLYGSLAGVVAAALTAINTFSIYYAQETRMYALLALWGAAGFYALIHFCERPGWRAALALALINAAGLWTQYAYPFLMLAQGVVALLWLMEKYRTEVKGLRTEEEQERHREIGKSPDDPINETTARNAKLPTQSSVLSPQSFFLYVAANLLTLLLYAAWLPTAWGQITTWPNTGDQTPVMAAAGITLRWLTFGLTAGDLPLAIPGILVLFGLTIRWNTTRRESLWRLTLPAAWTLIPLAIFLAAGLYRPDNVKVIIAAQIGLALMIGRGVHVLWTYDSGVRLRTTITRLAALASFLWLILTGINLLPPLYADPAFQRPDYRALAAVISAQAGANDAIILDAPNQEEVFRYYYRGDLPVLPLPPGLGGDDAATRAAVEGVLRDYERIYVLFWGETERDPQRVVETTLDANAFELGDTWYGDVRLARYVTPAPLPLERESGVEFGSHITLEGYALNALTFARGEALQLQFTWTTDTELITRYKVFLQVLDQNGVLVTQRDSEPGGGLAITTTWTPDQTVTDNHALLLDLPPGTYTLIAGLYDLEPPNHRLPVGDADYLVLETITVE